MEDSCFVIGTFLYQPTDRWWEMNIPVMYKPLHFNKIAYLALIFRRYLLGFSPGIKLNPLRVAKWFFMDVQPVWRVRVYGRVVG